MQGASNIQQAGRVSAPSTPQTGASNVVQKGKSNGESVSANVNASSRLDNAEEVAMFNGNKSRKLKVGSKEKGAVKQKTKEQKTEKAEKASKTDDASFAEEKASLLRLLKKFSKNEDVSEDEIEKMNDLLNGVDEDTNKAAEKILVKIVEFIDDNGGGVDYSENIDYLKKQLDHAKNNNEKVDSMFWSSLQEFAPVLETNTSVKKSEGEQSREFITTLGALRTKIKSEYKATNIQAAIAVEVKRIGSQVDQTKNNPERILVLGKEMHMLQTFRTLEESSEVTESKIARIYGYDKEEAL